MRRKTLQLGIAIFFTAISVQAQTSSAPAGPQPQTVTTPQSTQPSTAQAGQAQSGAPATVPTPQLPTTGPQQRLTVQDAEALALRNNPQISVYRLLSLASNQVTREQRSAYYPTIYGSLTGVEPKQGSRIAAGNLNNPIVYQRAAGGLKLSQLITDFGRTNNLVASAALRPKPRT